MKVLWFEITTPSLYERTNMVLGGWQDSLESVIKSEGNIELYVAFPSNVLKEKKEIDGVTYIPLLLKYSLLDKIQDLFTWTVFRDKLIERSLNVIKEVKPDIIHVFGTEYPYGIISCRIKIPVVLHIQGAMIPYHNAYYPPGYNNFSMFFLQFPNIIRQVYVWVKDKKEESRVRLEKSVWKSVSYYMGRTNWDKAMVSCFNPQAHYFHVDEVLRPVFYKTHERWNVKAGQRLKLLTIGIGTFWKGPDLILKTSNVLKQLNVDFEWNIAGEIRTDVRTVVEKRENLQYKDNHVNILGYVDADHLIELMLLSSMLVHTAYIDNSPNSICEAQLLGVPIISTMVGGIDSLIENGVNGILIPANDPWRLAYEIISLANNDDKMRMISRKAQDVAAKRHDRSVIKSQLMSCYNSILQISHEDVCSI